MAAKKKMSVADILAAARKSDAGEAGSAAESADASESKPAAEESKAEAKKPAGKTPAGERPSVADILAAARSKGGAKEEPAAKAAKPAAKAPAAKKPAAKKEVAKPATGSMSTSSILDAARGSTKRGPVSKGEAAAKAKPDAPAKPAGKQKIEVPPMPAKPGYAKTDKPAAQKAKQTDRRGFLSVMGLMVGTGLGVGFTSLTMTIVVWTLGLARFMFPNVRIEPPSKFKVGFPSDIAPGVVETKYKAQFGVWIVNAPYNGQQEIFALSTVCTHLGCTPNWLEAEQKFKCPCHGSGFYIDGINFEGPAPRPLERYSISVAGDGQLEVDKSLTFQQEKGQWDNPASYVPV